MAKKKVWLAVSGVALSSLLSVGLLAGLLPEKKKKCDHVFDEGNVVVSATCTTKEIIAYACTLCGELEMKMFSYAHEDADNDGTCDLCSDLIFNSVRSYEAVNVGDTLGGWYRMRGSGFVNSSFTVTCNLISTTDEDFYVNEEYFLSLNNTTRGWDGFMAIDADALLASHSGRTVTTGIAHLNFADANDADVKYFYVPDIYTLKASYIDAEAMGEVTVEVQLAVTELFARMDKVIF